MVGGVALYGPGMRFDECPQAVVHGNPFRYCPEPGCGWDETQPLSGETSSVTGGGWVADPQYAEALLDAERNGAWDDFACLTAAEPKPKFWRMGLICRVVGHRWGSWFDSWGGGVRECRICRECNYRRRLGDGRCGLK